MHAMNDFFQQTIVTLNIVLVVGDFSTRTFRQNEIRSSSSGVMAFAGNPDLPKFRIDVKTSMASAMNRLIFFSASSLL